MFTLRPGCKVGTWGFAPQSSNDQGRFRRPKVGIWRENSHTKCNLCNWFNPLGPERFQWNLRKIIFKLVLVTDGCDISSEIALRWTSLDLTDKSTLVQVMAWCLQTTSHYLNQCWLRSLPYDVTRPQCVNGLKITKTIIITSRRARFIAFYTSTLKWCLQLRYVLV